MKSEPDGLRSQRWFAARGVPGLFHRAYLKSEGISDDAFRGRPVIGILNPWSELVNHVLQADKGCDFDVLRKIDDEPFQTDPIGLDSSPH
jgi:dihydroxyacid dehydratase/phosphogluconate dehydratase